MRAYLVQEERQVKKGGVYITFLLPSFQIFLFSFTLLHVHGTWWQGLFCSSLFLHCARSGLRFLAVLQLELSIIARDVQH